MITQTLLARVLAVLAAVAVTVVAAAEPPPSASSPAPDASADRDPDLVLMTFNIRYATSRDSENAWDRRRDLLAEVIRDADPDVVGLQEALASQLDDLARLLPQYARIGVGRDDGEAAGEHSAILYRRGRFEVAGDGAEQGTFWLSDTPEVPGSRSWGNTIPRICTWARFIDRDAPPDSPGFYIFNTHLDHRSQPSRERAAELIAARIHAREHQDAPAILMGDLNAGEDNRVLRYLRGEIERASPADAPIPAPPPSPRLRCAFRAANPDAEDVGTYHGFTGVHTGDMIDHILVPQGTTVLASRIIRTAGDRGHYPSDHFPVLARVRLSNPRGAGE